MSRFVTRRRALQAAGTFTGTVLLGTGAGTARAGSLPERFIIDVQLVPDRVIDRILDKIDVDVLHHLPEVDALVVRAPPVELPDLKGILPDLTLAHRPPVETQDASARDRTTEPEFPLQWDKQTQAIPDVHETTRGSRTRVALIDTGIDATHPDLEFAVNDRLSRNFSGDGGGFDDVGMHGTHLGGIIAANDENREGIVGTAPATDLVALRVFEDIGTASFGDVLAALVYSVMIGADVANLSLGTYPVSKNDIETIVFRELFNRAGAFALANGTLPVAAIGNDATNLDTDGQAISLPSEIPSFMSVAATGPIGFRWDDSPDVSDPLADLQKPTWQPAVYTNYGRTAVDISAPGGNFDRALFDSGKDWFLDMVYSSVPSDVEGTYGWGAGTSMAVPQVVGAAALVKSIAPNLSATEVRQLLQRTARDQQPRRFHGHGHLDVAAAVAEAESLAG